MKHYNDFEQTDPAYKQALNNALTLFPYADNNLEDDINSTKRLIYINGFMDGVPFKEIRSLGKSAKEIFVYKIFNTETKKWSSGGSGPDWSSRGKSWTNIGHVKSHLKQFIDVARDTGQHINKIPDCWEIVEISSLSGEKRYKAKDLIKLV